MEQKDVDKLLSEKLEDGERKSCIAWGIKNYLIDIDGTVCDDIPNGRKDGNSQTLSDALETLNHGLKRDM